MVHLVRILQPFFIYYYLYKIIHVQLIKASCDNGQFLLCVLEREWTNLPLFTFVYHYLPLSTETGFQQ